LNPRSVIQENNSDLFFPLYYFPGSSPEHVGKSFICYALDGRCRIISPCHCSRIWRDLGRRSCHLRYRVCKLRSKRQILRRSHYSLRRYSSCHHVNEDRIYHDNEEPIIDYKPIPKLVPNFRWNHISPFSRFRVYSTLRMSPVN
jgi:hypothetical protein